VNERERIISQDAMVAAFYMCIVVVLVLVQLVERGSHSIPRPTWRKTSMKSRIMRANHLI
jgi:hypothetical protein